MRFEGDMVKRYINSLVIVPSSRTWHSKGSRLLHVDVLQALALPVHRSVASQLAE